MKLILCLSKFSSNQSSSNPMQTIPKYQNKTNTVVSLDSKNTVCDRIKLFHKWIGQNF